jgi:hypothetical protein
MASGLRWILLGASVLVLSAATAQAQEADDSIDLRVCAKHRFGTLSEDQRAACELFKGLDRHGRYKALILQRLRRWNQPPVAAIEILEVLPRRVDVSAEGSTDENGFPEVYYFALEDADSGDVLAGPVTTREPVATLETNQDLPQNLLVRVVVEDDLRAVDTAEEIVALSATHCANEFFACSSNGATTCTPRAGNNLFTTDDLLDAAQRCDRTITRNTPLTISAWGGQAGRGANVWPFKGGDGGLGGGARMETTLAEMDRVYKSPQDGTSYCYGVGQQGGHADTRSGAGGASTLLRTCQNVSQTAITGVLLIGGGGGGGHAAGVFSNGGGGSAGGVAASSAGAAASGAGSGGSKGGNQGKGGSGDIAGKDGVGGKGGEGADWGTAAWSRGNPRVEGDSGRGGVAFNAGGGGGGWGGGGGKGGGGGGGSYAAAGVATASGPGTKHGAGLLDFHFAP